MESGGKQAFFSKGGRDEPDPPIAGEIRPAQRRANPVAEQAEARLPRVRDEVVQQPVERGVRVARGGERGVLRTQRERVGSGQHHRVTSDQVAKQPDVLLGSFEDARGGGCGAARGVLGRKRAHRRSLYFLRATAQATPGLRRNGFLAGRQSMPGG